MTLIEQLEELAKYFDSSYIYCSTKKEGDECNSRASIIRQAISELKAREGWIFVPKEITSAMLVAFQDASNLHPRHKQIEDGYKAMIAAKP